MCSTYKKYGAKNIHNMNLESQEINIMDKIKSIFNNREEPFYAK